MDKSYLRCFCLCFKCLKNFIIKKNIKQKLSWQPQYLYYWWLESFKTTYGMREPTTVKSGKAGDVPIITIKAWMERFLELVKGYSFEDEINMNELELFFKTLKGLVEKGKKERGGKQSQNWCTVALFVAANGSRFVNLLLYGDLRSLFWRNSRTISGIWQLCWHIWAWGEHIICWLERKSTS